MFLLAKLVLYKDVTFAMCIVKTLLMVTSFLALMLLYALTECIEKRKGQEAEKLKAAKERICGSLESIRRAVCVLDEDRKEIVASGLKCEMENIINEFVMDTNVRVNQNFGQLAEEIRIPCDHAVFLTGALRELCIQFCSGYAKGV